MSSKRCNCYLEQDSSSRKKTMTIVIPKSVEKIILQINDEEEKSIKTEDKERSETVAAVPAERCKQEEEATSSTKSVVKDDDLIELEAEMVRVAEEVEEEERRKFQQYLEKEEYCLVDEKIVYRSPSALLAVGASLTKNFEPVIRISNPQITAAVVLEENEFKEFCAKLEKMISSGDFGTKDNNLIFTIKTHSVYYAKNKVVVFKSVTKGPKPLYVPLNEITTILDLVDNILEKLEEMRNKVTDFAAGYSKFTLSVASEIKVNGDNDFYKKVRNIIKKKYDNNTVLHDIALKLPYTLRRDVNIDLEKI